MAVAFAFVDVAKRVEILFEGGLVEGNFGFFSHTPIVHRLWERSIKNTKIENCTKTYLNLYKITHAVVQLVVLAFLNGCCACLTSAVNRYNRLTVSQVAEIKEKLDIVEIVGERINLQRSGKNLRGLCPFHSEKTPSFFVSPELQSFICFGCGKKGDVFSFVQEYDRLTFPEALELLADKAGVTLDKKNWSDSQEEQRRRLFAVLDLAQQYYAYILREHAQGAAAREYLKQRGTTNQTVKNFGLGYAPPGWDHLLTYLTRKKKFKPEEIAAAGLALQGRGGKYYDRFRERIIFPLHDHRGRVVGFSGRTLSADAKEAKYINSPETALYHKRYLLYGYHQNLEAIREKEAVIVTEGEFDALSSVQAHVHHVVAIKGSALTVEQVRILARTVKTIYLALDADNAGVAATSRAIEVAQPFPVALRVIPLSGGKDPDDLARQNPKHWRETVGQHVSAFEYVLDTTCQGQDLSTAQGQKTVATTLLKLLLSIENAVERSFYLKQLAAKLDVPETVLEEDWERMRRRATAEYQLPARAKPTESEPGPTADRLGAYTWQLLLRLSQYPAKADALQPAWFSEPIHQRLAQAYLKWQSTHAEFILEKFSRQLPAELQPIVSELYLADLPLAESEWSREFLMALTQLQQRADHQQRQRIADDLAQLEQKTKLTPEEKAAYEDLQREFVALNRA